MSTASSPGLIPLFGAILLGGTIIGETYILWKNKEGWYALCAKVLGFIIGFEVITGSALAFLSSRASLPTVCTRMGAYFLILLVAEFTLYFRMGKIPNIFPFRQVITLPAIGLICVLILSFTRINQQNQSLSL